MCSQLRMAEHGVSPDLITVINVSFEAGESAQSCGKGEQITGWGGAGTVPERLLKACPSGSDSETKRQAETEGDQVRGGADGGGHKQGGRGWGGHSDLERGSQRQREAGGGEHGRSRAQGAGTAIARPPGAFFNLPWKTHWHPSARPYKRMEEVREDFLEAAAGHYRGRGVSAN